VVVGTRVTRIDPAARTVLAADGRSFPYDRLLIATGASPVRLPLPGAELPQVHLLRGLSDARALIARADGSRRAVVIGASFIGLEVAASLRARGLEVRVVAPEARPLERVLGPQLGDFVRELHEQHGVIFALGHVPTRIDPGSVTLDDGQVLPADLVVMGTGVRPNVELAEAAGLRIDKGIVVDSYLESSYPGIYAAGDVARYLDPRTGERVRIEHWAVAQRMGTTAARNMLGQQQAFDAVPYFWSQHYDVRISYVGHAEKWNRIDVSHGTDRKQWVARFVASGRTLAVATVGHDQISLQAEVTLEQWKPATAAGPSSPDRSGAGSAGIG
jgi:NADPH-dependent 2,4-dienoyl-CoA reductase/sulfur reductase-like enzyme